MPEQPGFSIRVIPMSDKDHTDPESNVPEWCELVFMAQPKDGSPAVYMPLTRNAAEAMISAAHEIMHPYRGHSIIEGIWKELDDTVDRLHTDEKQSDDPGYARGLAYALAHLRNPYETNVDMVRNQAGRRYRLRQAEREEKENEQ